MREKPINFDLESHQSLSAKHRYYRNCPANKTGSHFTRWEWKLSESLGDLTIWSAILASNQLWQTQAHSCQCHRLLQNEPILLVCCKSCGICCQASVWQRFELRVGRKEHIKYCGEMRRAVYRLQPAEVEVYWASERGWFEQPAGLWCRNCLNSLQALNCTLQRQYITFPRCPPECSPQPHA